MNLMSENHFHLKCKLCLFQKNLALWSDLNQFHLEPLRLTIFRYDGNGILCVEKDGDPFMPNDRYTVENGDFCL